MHLRTRLSKSQSKSFARTRRERRIWAAGLIVVVLLAWIFVLSRLSYLNAFSINNVQVYGADPDIVATLRSAALSELDGSYLKLFARADAALYPKTAIAAAIMAASPRINSVDIHHAGIHGLSVTVNERTPAAIVCNELPDFTSDPESDSNCYFADSRGLIFESASTSASELPDRYYEPDLSAPLGSYATSTAEFEGLQSFMRQAHEAGLEPMGMLFKDNGEYEFYVMNPSAISSSAGHAGEVATGTAPDIAVIYLNDAAGLPTELSDLTAFWNKEMSDGRAAGNLPRFESIDLRYGSNVFYRLEK